MIRPLLLALIFSTPVFAIRLPPCPLLLAKAGAIVANLQSALETGVGIDAFRELLKSSLDQMDPAQSPSSTPASLEQLDSLLDREKLRKLAFNPSDNNPVVRAEIVQLLIDLDTGLVDFPLSVAQRKTLAKEIESASGSPRNALNIAMRSEPLRERLVERSLGRLQAASISTKQRLRQTQERGSFNRVDLLVIGAGLQEQNGINLLRELGSTLSVLTIEKESVPLSTFARGGKLFTTNSPSRPPRTESIRQIPNRLTPDERSGGDLNFLPGGFIQVRDFVYRAFPFAGDFAQAGQVNRGFSLSTENSSEARFPIAFEEELLTVSPVTDPIESADGLYTMRVTLASGLVVYPRAIVATGIGLPKKQIASSARVMRWEKFLEQANRDPEGTFELFNGKRVLVVGKKDSAIAAVRFVSGNRPEALGGTRAQGEGALEIFWSGQTCKTCEAFRDENRSINSDLGTLFRSGRVKAVARTLDASESNGKVSVTLDDSTRIDGLDYVILADGYEPSVPGFLAPYAQTAQPRLVEVDEPGLGRVAIARQYVTPVGSNPPLNFIVLGPQAEDIISEQEIGGINDNRVGNFVWNWRTWRVFALLEKLLSLQPSPAAPSNRIALKKVTPLRLNGKPTAYRLEEAVEELNKAVLPPASRGVFPVGARIRIDRDNADGTLLLGTNGLTAGQADSVARLLDTVIETTPVFLNWVNYQMNEKGYVEIQYLGGLVWDYRPSPVTRMRIDLDLVGSNLNGISGNYPVALSKNYLDELKTFFAGILGSDIFDGTRIFLDADETDFAVYLYSNDLEPQALARLGQLIRGNSELFRPFAARGPRTMGYRPPPNMIQIKRSGTETIVSNLIPQT
jgi:hypothetical protein